MGDTMPHPEFIYLVVRLDNGAVYVTAFWEKDDAEAKAAFYKIDGHAFVEIARLHASLEEEKQYAERMRHAAEHSPRYTYAQLRAMLEFKERKHG